MKNPYNKFIILVGFFIYFINNIPMNIIRCSSYQYRWNIITTTTYQPLIIRKWLSTVTSTTTTTSSSSMRGRGRGE